ncbi:MAG TPA: hypothetical protein VLJ61_12730 [Pyrinomonadaceae bacterium]|nr:hypothetical protein [Pyrinomonadaceae bacterium]
MKKITAGMFVTLAAIALAAPFFAMAVLVGLRVVESATGLRENFLLLVFAVAAAASAVINARGERSAKPAREMLVAGRRSQRKASALHLGW